MMLCFLCVAIVPSAFVEAAELKDSGIDYSDGRETVIVDGNTRDALYLNPYRGFHVWAQPGVLKLTNDDNNVAVSPNSTGRALIYFPVEISDFSGAYHPTAEGARGDDAELNQNALDALDETLKNVKKNNRQVILRFVYDKGIDGIKAGEGCLIPDEEIVVPEYWTNSNRVIEPRQEMIMRHIEQLAPILIENQDAIYTVQVGFYGGFGELHSTGACSDAYIAEALDKMLNETRGSNLIVSARTPRRYVYYRFGKTGINQLIGDITTEGEDAYRIAIFNDGYLSNDNDYGTYENREIETDWMATQNLHNPYGGDAIPAPGGKVVGEPAKQPFVINEMAKVHTSYASADNLLQTYWKETQYDGTLYADSDYTEPDAEYEGATLYEYIENHLGYRFVIRESKLSETVKSGGTLENVFKIENVGFGNLLSPVESYVYITDKSGDVVLGPVEADVDPMDFKINSTVSNSLSVKLPTNLEPGEYKLYIQFKIGDHTVDGKTKPYGAIRLANSGVWDSILDANFLGAFNVERELTITKKWDDKSRADLRPDSLTFTIEEEPRLPSEYQEVEYISSGGTQWIDTGVKMDAAHTIYSDGYSHPDGANHLLQAFVDNNNRLGVKIYGKSKKIQYYWRIAGGGQGLAEVLADDLGGIDVTKRFKMTQSASGLKLSQGDLEFSVSYAGSTEKNENGTWKVFYYNNSTDNVPRGFLYEAKILDGNEVIHHYVPCYRKSDEAIGVYDLVDGVFLENSGSGVFAKGEDVVPKKETLTIAKDKWTINGDTWETKVGLVDISGKLLIYESEISDYESDATKDSKKTITDNAVVITNTCTKEDPQPDPDPEEEITYSNTEGDGTTWYDGSGEDAAFVFKRSENDSTTFSHFMGILVDGEPVDESNYDAEPGSVIVKLKASYLETLSPGEHIITALFNDGNNPTAKFVIKEKKTDTPGNSDSQKEEGDKPQGGTEAPNTGDEGGLILWAIILVLSIVSIHKVRI